MKPTAIALLFLGSFLFACDNDDDVKPDDVPVAVKDTLVNTFPNAQNIEWDKKGEDYEADFDQDTVEYDALLNASGALLMHKYDIAEAALPEEVKASITQNYAGYRVDDAEVVDRAGALYYQVDLEKDNSEEKLVLSADGQAQTEIPYWE
ncbi:PepSY-like domain-containing protein [Pontibacter actiniarum]|uniref:Putative beta-lactamase-inhibitor-like PepSY-like domain-containing protein n=1 Tax=Pontibacter actiniarum TaxID=323450 RepID=A0A1X9YWI4_9BACT|nr:PepSY-like domain-containing protein [Pontibacter actiniarum]ARS37228.1 hypothetical protein CA264_18330 [Pontibacter actiniarum]